MTADKKDIYQERKKCFNVILSLMRAPLKDKSHPKYPSGPFLSSKKKYYEHSPHAYLISMRLSTFYGLGRVSLMRYC